MISWRHVPESRERSRRGPVDLPGAIWATVALGGGVFALMEAPAHGWTSPRVLAGAALGLFAAVAFVLVERRSTAPMLPFALFRSRNFSGANLLTLLLYAALGGGLFYFPLNLIELQGYSATAAGAALVPFVAIMFMLSGWAGRLVDRFGPRRPLIVGPAIAACGFALFALPGRGGSYWGTFFPAVVVLGIGMTITVAPLTTTVMNAVAQDLAGLASGVNNALSRTAALLAIALFGVVMAAARDDFLAGFRWVMGISAGLAVLSALSAGLLIEHRGPRPPEAGTAAGSRSRG